MRRGTFDIVTMSGKTTDYYRDGFKRYYYDYKSVSGYTDDIIMPSGRVLHIGLCSCGRIKGKTYYDVTDLDTGMGVLCGNHCFNNRKEVIEHISTPDYLSAIERRMEQDDYKDMVRLMKAYKESKE